MNLSPHFTLKELTRTSHRTIDNKPEPVVVERLIVLCKYFLEPVRDVFGPLWITSGYRCPALNRAIGGSASSAHMYGCAADFVPITDTLTVDIVNWIVHPSGIDYDQVIDEYSSTDNWIHLGMARPGRSPRHEALEMNAGKYTLFHGDGT